MRPEVVAAWPGLAAQVQVLHFATGIHNLDTVMCKQPENRYISAVASSNAYGYLGIEQVFKPDLKAIGVASLRHT